MRYLTADDLRSKGVKFLPVRVRNFELGDELYHVNEQNSFKTADEIYDFFRDKNAAILVDDKDIAVKMIENGTYTVWWGDINPRWIEGPILHKRFDVNTGSTSVYVGTRMIAEIDFYNVEQNRYFLSPEEVQQCNALNDWLNNIPNDILSTSIKPESEIENKDEEVKDDSGGRKLDI